MLCVTENINIHTYGHILIFSFDQRSKSSFRNTECLQMNGAVSKVNKKFISHLTRAKHTPLAEATLPVSYVLITIFQRFARVT